MADASIATLKAYLEKGDVDPPESSPSKETTNQAQHSPPMAKEPRTVLNRARLSALNVVFRADKFSLGQREKALQRLFLAR